MPLSITWYGTACFLVHLNGIDILFDPFFLRNSDANPHIRTKPEDLENVDAVFITHAHFDHITEAGWFAEQMDIPIYCSEIAKENIIKWMNGEIIEDHKEKFSKRAENNIHIIDYNDSIEISKEIRINSIKSCHIKFDTNTILSRLFSWKFIKNLRSISAYGRGFPLGKVFGYHIKYKNLNIVNFGSLCSENIGELNQYKDCDVLLIPYAGNSVKHLIEKALALLDIIKPKIIIPHHWDDFFPPISRKEDLDPLIKQIKEEYPEINVIRLPFEKKKKILSSNAVLN